MVGGGRPGRSTRMMLSAPAPTTNNLPSTMAVHRSGSTGTHSHPPAGHAVTSSRTKAAPDAANERALVSLAETPAVSTTTAEAPAEANNSPPRGHQGWPSADHNIDNVRPLAPHTRRYLPDGIISFDSAEELQQLPMVLLRTTPSGGCRLWLFSSTSRRTSFGV
jgi:hypothetical protein